MKLDGTEQYSINAIESGQKEVSVAVKGEQGEFTFEAQIRIDTPNEFSYFSDGGILQYVLRSLNKSA